MAANAGNKAIRQLRRVLLLQDGADPTDGQLLGWFVEQHDEVAFEALVLRHGPMVMGLCRRALHNEHDAEDAFQATFLVLVRKAASIVPRERVANWLYGVAHQTAFRARVSNAKRRERQKQLMRVAQTSSVSPSPWDDLRTLLDREVSRLPEKYRAPVVLCDLEGKTRKEAARHLGWPEGSVSSRLARARALLARRLSRRGLVLSAGTLAGLISVHGAVSAVPASLVASTVKAASPVATGVAGASALISANVAALAEGVLRNMFRAKLNGIIRVLLVLGMAAGVACFGVVVLNNRLAVAQPLPEDRPAAAPPRSARQPRLRATFEGGEKDPGTAVAISGDGRILASQSEDEVVKLWDVGTGKEKTTLNTMHKPPVASVALNEDGKLLATAGGEGVKLWDVARGTAKATLEGHTDKVTSVAVSADGKLVASGSEDNTVRLWDAVTGKEKATLKGHTGKVTSVALRRDGGLVVSGSEDHTVRLWDAATGREIVALQGHTAGVTSVAISRDGKVVASGSEDDTVRVWDVAAAKEKATFKGQDEVLCVAISGDGKLVASGSGEGPIKLWDAIAAKENATLEGHTGKVTSLAFNRDGKLLVSGSKDMTARLWDIPVGSPKSK